MSVLSASSVFVKKILRQGLIMFVLALSGLYSEGALAAAETRLEPEPEVEFEIEPAPEPEPGPDTRFFHEMVFVKGGCFDMGDASGRVQSDEMPVHRVCVDDFYIGKYEVTQRQWMEITESNFSYFKYCDDCPVDTVTWKEIQGYIKALNALTGQSYRLPTEAEWEYAARSGGKEEKWAGVSDDNEFGDYAWYEENSAGETQPVGTRKPNGLGLYDMSGNVREWVSDWYDENYYSRSPHDNPKGPRSGKYKVDRGGSWSEIPEYVRTTVRSWGPPVRRDRFVGFRLAASPKKVKEKATDTPDKTPPEAARKWMEIDRMMEEFVD